MSGALTVLAASLRAIGGVVNTNIRQLTLSAMTETGTGPYNYASTGDAAAYATNGSIPLASDGSFEVTVGAITTNHLIGLQTTTGNVDFNPGSGFQMYVGSGGSYTFSDANGSVPASVTTAYNGTAGYKHRLRPIGKVVVAEIFVSGAWVLLHIFSAARVGTLYPYIRTFNSGNQWNSILQSIGQIQAHWADQTANLVFDGNSLMVRTGDSLTDDLPIRLSHQAPILGSRSGLTNTGVDGQSTEDMIATPTTTDAAWVSGKINVLILWEGTNSIANVPESAATAGAAMASYIAARQAVHTWDKVIVINTIPRQGGNPDGTTLTNLNQALVDYNTYLVTNQVSMGITAICDLRPVGAGFYLTTFTDAGFAAAPAAGYWIDPSPNRLHLNDAGYTYVVSRLIATLNTLGIS